ALAEHRPALRIVGFDLSSPMLEQARARTSRVRFIRADAADSFPFRTGQCALIYAVDVIHHLVRLDRFFAEAGRALAADGHLLIVTDSKETMHERGLTTYFPEILEVELQRYPDPGQLEAAAAAARLTLIDQQAVGGDIPLSDEFIARLEAKCSSAM